MKYRLAVAIVVILGLTLFCRSAQANKKGVVLINQTRALAGKVTPGDSPGFPVTLSRPGSYRLSGNVTVPDENTTAIEITSGDVSLDLNGFAIEGPCQCTFDSSGAVCSPTGSGRGVFAYSNQTTNLAVTNGTVRGMGDFGLFLYGENSSVEQVRASSNGGTGIFVRSGTATNNTASYNGGDGISVAVGTATENNASYNGGRGISIHGTATNNTADYNGGRGISIAVGTATNNTASYNEGVGIRAENASDNTATWNTLHGLVSTGGYANNVFKQNNGGDANPQVSGGVQLGSNLCGNALCP